MRFEEADMLSGILIERLTQLEAEIHLSKDPSGELYQTQVKSRGLVTQQLNQLKMSFPELDIPEFNNPEKNSGYVVTTLPHDVPYNSVQLVTERPEGLDLIEGQVPVGIHVSITYVEGLISHIVTRGSGTEGEDVTLPTVKVADIPLKLPTLRHYKLVVQGIIGVKTEHHRIDESSLSVRNTIAGILRGRDVADPSLNHLTFLAVDAFGSSLKPATYSEMQTTLKELGFTVLSSPQTTVSYLTDCISYTERSLKTEFDPMDSRSVVRYIHC